MSYKRCTFRIEDSLGVMIVGDHEALQGNYKFLIALDVIQRLDAAQESRGLIDVERTLRI